MPELTERSKKVRRDVLELSSANGGYHYGGSFSVVEILLAIFDERLNLDPHRLVFSKGHACWPLYVLLRVQGFDPILEGHPVRDPRTGIHCTTGSLGHGLPTAIGMAQAKKMQGVAGDVVVVMSDGECQEGTTWESMLLAARLQLDNLIVVVDWNGIQGSGYTKDILPVPRLTSIAGLIGWDTEDVRDGHDIETLRTALTWRTDRPRMIVANTIKGCGVLSMENDPAWHAKWPNKDEYARAMKELK